MAQQAPVKMTSMYWDGMMGIKDRTKEKCSHGLIQFAVIQMGNFQSS